MLDNKLPGIADDLTRTNTLARATIARLTDAEHDIDRLRTTLDTDYPRADGALDGLTRVVNEEEKHLERETAQAQKALQSLAVFLIAEFSHLAQEMDQAIQVAHALSVYVVQQEAQLTQLAATMDSEITTMEKQTETLKQDVVTHLQETRNLLHTAVDGKLEAIRSRLHTRAGELTQLVEKDCNAAFTRIASALGSKIDQGGHLVTDALAAKESEIGTASDRAYQLLAGNASGHITELMNSASTLSHSLEAVQSKIQAEAKTAAALQQSATTGLSTVLITINTVLGLIHDLEHLFKDTLARHV